MKKLLLAGLLVLGAVAFAREEAANNSDRNESAISSSVSERELGADHREFFEDIKIVLKNK